MLHASSKVFRKFKFFRAQRVFMQKVALQDVIHFGGENTRWQPHWTTSQSVQRLVEIVITDRAFYIKKVLQKTTHNFTDFLSEHNDETATLCSAESTPPKSNKSQRWGRCTLFWYFRKQQKINQQNNQPWAFSNSSMDSCDTIASKLA